ncbi:hypothetical protein ELI07_19700 [Rhizobium leguminosarum]|nr:hypothetical protein ELI40_21700 [Rhizobium leguminosarum]TAX11576.1 hypothetical protein ELI07_19700 [Rhizobium leguminosarum]TAY14465.1 hypothetical protein ELH96_23160 [Rhizobium leguminosarum]TAZ16518.1 hypothetical protein ELH81_21720 [Rhizobium leguminosarum]
MTEMRRRGKSVDLPRASRLPKIGPDFWKASCADSKCYSVLARETRGAVVRPNVTAGTLAICGGSGKLSLSCHMWRPCETDDRSAGFAIR